MTLSVQGHHPLGKGGKFDPLSHGLQSTGVFSPNSLHRIFPHFGLVCFCCFLDFSAQRGTSRRSVQLARSAKLDFNFIFSFFLPSS